MKEAMTEEIYYAMLDAEYTKEEAEQLCTSEWAQFLYKQEKTDAIYEFKMKLKKELKFFKELLKETELKKTKIDKKYYEPITAKIGD